MSDKLKDTIYYLLLKYSTLLDQYNTKKKLAKLLYFIDFYYYKENEDVIATSEYKALPMGPVPVDFYTVLSEMEDDGLVIMDKVTMVNNSGKKYDYEVYRIDRDFAPQLSEEEKRHIDMIFDKFKFATALELEQISHLQAPWNSVDEKETIPIETAFLLPDFESIK